MKRLNVMSMVTVVSMRLFACDCAPVLLTASTFRTVGGLHLGR